MNSEITMQDPATAGEKLYTVPAAQTDIRKTFREKYGWVGPEERRSLAGRVVPTSRRTEPETLAEIECTLEDVDVVIVVTEYEPYRPACVSGPPEMCSPAEGGCGEYYLLNAETRARHPAPRSDAVERYVQEQIFRAMEGDKWF